MTRTGGVSTASATAQAVRTQIKPETRGDENRKGEATDDGLGAATVATKRRSGMVRRPAAPDRTARPANVEGMRAKPQERRTGRSVRRREGDGRPIDRAGDQGSPTVATGVRERVARRGTAPGERATGEGRPDSTPPRSGRRVEAVTPGPDRETELAVTGKPIRPNGLEGNILRTSRKTPGAKDPRLASRTVRP